MLILGEPITMTSIRAIFLAYFSMILFALTDNVRGPLYPEVLTAFQISNTWGAWFFSTVSLASVAGAFAVKPSIQLMGYRKSLILSLSFLAAALVGTSVAPTYELLLLCMVSMGLAFGSLGVLQNAIVSKAAPEHQLLQYQSGLHSLYGFGSFVAPLFAAFIFSFVPNWRLPFGIIAVLVGLLILRVWRDGEIIPKPSLPSASGVHANRRHLPEIIFWSVVLSLYVIVEIFIGTRVAQYFREAHGYEFTGSSFAVSFFFAGLFLGRIFFVLRKTRMALLGQIQICLLGSAILIMAGLLRNFHFAGSYWLIAVSGFTMGPIYPMMMTWLSRKFKDDLETVFASCLIFSGVFNLAMHSSVGILTDQFGIARAFWLCPLILCVGVLLMVRYRVRNET